MTEFLGLWGDFSIQIFLHVFRMMYWVWIPGALCSALLAIRYGPALLRRLAGERGGWFRPLGAAAAGLLASGAPRQAASLTPTLLRQGFAPADALTAGLGARLLPPYLLAVLMALAGLEFALGLLLGSVALIAVGRWVSRKGVFSTAREPGHARWVVPDSADAPIGSAGSWPSVLGTAAGWQAVGRYLLREAKGQAGSLLAGLVAGGFILAAGLAPWWPELSLVPGGGLRSDIVNGLVGALLAPLIPLAGVGRLFVGAYLFKTEALGYAGTLAFLLASPLAPHDLWRTGRLLGARAVARLGPALALGAFIGAVGVTWFFTGLGLRPSHVPWFRSLVDRIIMALPFTMGPM